MLKKILIAQLLAYSSIASADSPVSVTSLPSGQEDATNKVLQFLLPAQSGEVTLLDATKKSYQLTFRGTAATTVFFTGSPIRIEGTMTTEYFLKRWAKTGHDNYTDTPPNLAITYTDPATGMRNFSVVQAMNPQYDPTQKVLKMTLQAINDSFPVTLPSNLVAPEIVFAAPAVCGLLGSWGDLPGEKHYDQKCHEKAQQSAPQT